MEYSQDILIEYMKDRNLNRAITEVQKRKAKEEELKKEPVVVEKIEATKQEDKPLESPKILKEIPKTQLGTATFKVVASREKIEKLVKFMKDEEIKYEQLKQEQ